MSHLELEDHLARSHTENAAIAQLQHLSEEGSIWKLCKEGPLDALKEKVDNGYTFDALNERGTFGETILHVAILYKQTEIAKYLVTKFPEIVNAHYAEDEYYGETALHMAIVSRDYQLTEYLLSHGADPNIGKATGKFFAKSTGTVYYGEYAITFAIHTLQPEMVRLLHRHDADLSVRDAFGQTVLHHCVHTNSTEMFDVLLELNCNFQHISNAEGLGVLQYAAKLGQKEIFDHILEKTKVVGWEWGDVSFYAFPIAQIDTHGDNKHSVLETIITRHRGDFVMNPVILEVLSEKWKAYGRRLFFVWFILHIMYCVMLTVTCLRFPLDDIRDHLSYPLWIKCSAVIIACKAVTMSLVEIFEYFGLVREHGMSRAWYIYFEKGDSSSLAISSVTGIFKLLAWTANITTLLCIIFVAIAPYIKAFESLGRLVVTISKILAKDVTKFGLVFLIILCAFSSALALLTTDSEEGTWLDSMFIMFEISFGMGDFFGDEMIDPFELFLAKTLYVLYLTLSVALLFNLLIAIMTETTEEVRQQAKEQWLLQWASTVLLLERRVPKCLYKRTGNPGSEFGFSEQDVCEQYFITFTHIQEYREGRKVSNEDMQANISANDGLDGGASVNHQPQSSGTL